MIGRNNERWRQLCEQASVEQDPEKLLNLVREINRLLDEKQARLKNTAEREINPFASEVPAGRHS